MSAITTIFTVLQVISGLAVTVVVLMQSGKSSGLGSISGGAETFMAKGKAKSLDAKLAKATKWFALAFVVLTLIQGYGKKLRSSVNKYLKVLFGGIESVIKHVGYFVLVDGNNYIFG